MNEQTAGAVVGVDIGGTFTDLVMNADGRLTIHKLLSTPDDPSRAMLAGLDAIGGGESLARVAHGSTVATNAILERKGARVAFIATQGFRDLLLIGRQNRPDLYALAPHIPPPLVPRERCYDLPERLDASGAVLVPLDLHALDAILDAIAAQDVDAVAVCLLYSFLNPAHEHAVRDRIAARGLKLPVALSCEVLPEFREYERASATVLEAYVRPIMARYVTRLTDRLSVPLRIMKSDGGVMSAQRVRRQAIHTALSGPAAGVTGAFHLARLAGYDHIITLDMGGTSTDVALCPGGLVLRPESHIDGLPLRIRLLDIETVGAGGGSTARIDSGGALRVGPESAGAVPGPVVYGRGGTLVTVSDANAVLGRLDADHFLGGHMRLDTGAAEAAFQPLAAALQMSVRAAAQGVIAVANATIDRAVRRVSVARGHDPRAFTLVAFGGAGGLHACAIADGLRMRRILIPRYPGVLCAFGLLVADVTLEYSQTLLCAVDDPRIDAALRDLGEQAAADLQREGLRDALLTPLLDMRYRGQAYELSIAETGHGAGRRAAFEAAHEAAYGYTLARPVDVVTVRVQAVGVVDKPALEPEAVTPQQLTGTRFEREALRPGARFSGEALVFQLDSTSYIAPGWEAQVDAYHNLILEKRYN